MTTTDATPERPLLFISHKHENQDIASVLREFVEVHTGGAVEVYQSSSEQASGPRLGFSLTQELKSALWRASAFILIYTTPDREWSYCMYEYGVANNPKSPDTRMLLLRCCEATPALFAGQVTVNARSREEVEKFVNQILTDPEFFRGHGRAITQHQPKSRTIAMLSETLWQNLQKYMPETDTPKAEEWPAYPFIQLQLPADRAHAIRDAASGERPRIAAEILAQEAVVSDYDKVAGRLFNSPTFDKGMKFGALVQLWKEKDDRRDAKSRWIESLIRQIADGARWKFPALSWELMQGIEDDRWYAPMLTRVRRVPDQYYQFDIYFFRFELDPAQQHAILGIPPEE